MRRMILIVLAAAVLAPPPARADAEPILDLHVRFSVRNVNMSKVPCQSDGLAYTLDGRLVGPESALYGGRRSVTVYLHGGMVDDIWHFAVPGNPSVDYVTAQARARHASLIFDNLGFGQSDIPNGNDVCDGSWADMADQVIAALRSGAYEVDGRPAPRFDRVALAGISGGGRIAQIVAYSFPEHIDALIVSGWADAADAQVLEHADWGEPFTRWELECATGGEDKRGGGSGGGFAYLLAPGQAASLFFNAEPQVVSATDDAIERDLCGDAHSIGTAIEIDQVYVPTIAVPVLLTYGDHDLFGPVSAAAQRARYAGSDDVGLAIVPDTGHVPMLERTAAQFVNLLGGWLRARGF